MISKVSTAMNINVNKGMLNMAKGLTIQKVFEIAGDRFPESFKVWVNNELQKISK